MDSLLFKDLKVSKEILKAIEDMGFEETTPIQKESIPPILDGSDVIAQAPTGTGKTCAFGIPVIEKINTTSDAIQVLILCPTRELVIQSAEELKNLAKFKKGIKIVPIYGGQPIDRQIMALKKHPQIVIATPGRMMDHLRRKTAKISSLEVVVLDEADEMLNMGFREDIDTILETVPEQRQTILFSATLSKEIMEIAGKYQKDAVLVRVTHKELTVPTIEQFYLEVSLKNKIDVLTRLIDTNSFKLCLVFCNTKRRVDELTSDLGARGYMAEALHGDMKQTQRDRVMTRFRKGLVEILVATDVAARGIDVDDIEAVFNFDLPSDEEYYVHRIGRTGRANKRGISYTFVCGREIFKLRDIMRYTHSNIIPLKAPSVSDVEEIRLQNLFEQVKNIIAHGKLTKYARYIENVLSEDENNEITSIDIAAALLNMAMGNNSSVSTVESSRPTLSGMSNSMSSSMSSSTNSGGRRETGLARPDIAGMTRIFINIGTLDKIRPRHIVELVASNTTVEGSLVGTINLYDKYSFFEVPADKANEVIGELTGLSYKGRTIAIEKAKAKQ